MSSALEAIGMSLPYSSGIPAMDPGEQGSLEIVKLANELFMIQQRKFKSALKLQNTSRISSLWTSNRGEWHHS